MKQFNDILAYCNEVAFDLNFTKAKEWKAAEKNRALVAFLPIYFPREIIYAVNGLAVGLMGVGDRKQIIKGDAYYQSYICHLPRGIIEMALDKTQVWFNEKNVTELIAQEHVGNVASQISHYPEVLL